MSLRNGLILPLTVSLCAVTAGFPETTNHFFQFVQDQSDRRYSRVPHEVLALYYGWFKGGKWDRIDPKTQKVLTSVREPTKHQYDSHDPSIVDAQIEEARAHGITCFVLSWWGTGPENAIHEQSMQLLIDRAEKKNFKVSILWEQAPGAGQHQVDRAVVEVSYALKRYGKSKVFLKVDGKPVIFIYERVLQQIPTSRWPEITTKTRAEAGDFVFIGNGYESQENGDYLFDGMSSFDFEFMPGNLRSDHLKAMDEFRRWARGMYRQYVETDRRHNRISCLGVIPGFDNTKSNPPGMRFDRGDGQTYRALWEAALEANPDWIMLSWNEWGEGTEIEPSVELGDKYLLITAEYAERFLKSPTAAFSPPLVPPRSVAGIGVQAESILAGRSVGMIRLGRFADPEFWALYCGAEVVLLTWEDLIDPAAFNGAKLPLVICVGNEHYRSSIKAMDDVTMALARYLRQGGFLALLPVAPWPLHYDDSRGGAAYTITDKLAMGITGWDSTNLDTHPEFYVNTNALKGLPETAPFPTTGDLRWTGATPGRVPPSELYTSLVRLRDKPGHSSGDAVVYIQHRTPSLDSGKTLYVWMRMAEIFGENEFYPSLYQFASARLKPQQK